MSTVATIAAVSLRRMLRDRTALFFIFGLPVFIILLIGLAIGGVGRTPAGVVDEDSGPLGAELRVHLLTSPDLLFEEFEDVDALRKAVRRGVVSAGVVIPRGYDEDLRAGRSAEVQFIFDLTAEDPLGTRATVNAVVVEQGTAIGAAQFAVEQAGGDFDAHLARARELAADDTGVGVGAEVVGTQQPRLMQGFAYTAPSNLVLFVFITSLAASAQLIEARRLGITRRMLGAPLRPRTVLTGMALSRFGIAAVQALFILVVGSLVFGVDWGSPAGAAAIVVLFALVGTSVAMLVGTVFRTPEQAGSIGPPIGIALGMLGGCMWPLEIVSPTMRAIGHAFPHAWAMDAWIELMARGGGVGDIVTELAVLALFSAVLLPIATWRLRRAIVT